jgi:glycosyltransferase involved in cell wall biosynthesis
MIVKNESKVLKRLIDSCINIIDYYVIIDTGSTDDTIELLNKLLKKKKGEMHQRPWVNFGFNRTELMALSYGKADYILLADADNEYIIRNFDKNVLVSDYYYLKYEGSLSWMNIFIVKGDIHWYYKGHVHEYIVVNGYSNGGCIDSIKIIHHGDGGNPNRDDIKILLNAIKEDPDDARNYFYLAQSYKDVGDYANALIYYKKRILMDGWNEEVFYSLYQSGLMLYNLGEIDKAIITLMNSYNYRPSRFEPLYFIGWII